MKKWRAIDWMGLLLKGIAGGGFFLFAVQHILLGAIHNGPHGEVQSRPYFVPRQIEQAAEAGGRIYILYHDSGAVNVYDSQGQFLWAVSIPWHDHDSDVRLRVDGESLILYQRRFNVYQFDGETGKQKAVFPWEGNEERFPDVQAPKENGGSEREPGSGCYDDLTVYRVGECGELIPLIRRSGWVRLLYFISAWAMGFFGIAGMILLDNTIKPAIQRREERKRKTENGKDAGAQK